jgi:hypothetical protein
MAGEQLTTLGDQVHSFVDQIEKGETETPDNKLIEQAMEILRSNPTPPGIAFLKRIDGALVSGQPTIFPNVSQIILSATSESKGSVVACVSEPECKLGNGTVRSRLELSTVVRTFPGDEPMHRKEFTQAHPVNLDKLPKCGNKGVEI